jgi:hypothetical protein
LDLEQQSALAHFFRWVNRIADFKDTMTTRKCCSTRGSSKLRGRPAVCSALALLATVSKEAATVEAFQPSCIPQSSSQISSHRRLFRLYSSIGGDGDDTPRPPPGGNGGDGNGGLDDFLKPKEESENLKKAREYMSETRLPISFDHSNEVSPEIDMADDEEQDSGKEEEEESEEEEMSLDPKSSALVNGFGASGNMSLFGSGQPSSDLLANNPYMQVVSKLSPSELISKFTATANPRVQDAVRTTILGLIGSLPKMAFDTTTITSGQRLASLMFQLQMTGYMFKNAEYRLSLSQSLGMTNANGYSSKLLLAGTEEEADEDEEYPSLMGKVKGKLKIHYGGDLEASDGAPASKGMEIEVDAAAYMSELRSEVAKLKEDLAQTREAKEEALRNDLLMYIRTLPAQELQSLTNTMSQDVLVGMKGLVGAVLSGIGDGKIGPETVTEQSGEAMAQLCMWQLAVGYNLRELEVREEMRKSLEGILDEEIESGLDGTLE